jgi:hypothetical protein
LPPISRPVVNLLIFMDISPSHCILIDSYGYCIG